MLEVEYHKHYDILIMSKPNKRSMLSRSETDFIVESWDEDHSPSQLLISKFLENLNLQNMRYEDWLIVKCPELPAPIFYLQEVENLCAEFFKEQISIVENLRQCLSIDKK